MDIELKAWSKSMNQMFCIGGDFTLMISSTGHKVQMWCSDGISDEFDVDNVLLSTGKFDSDGVMLFEGDVISDHVGIGVIAYCQDNCALKVSYVKENKGFGKWFCDYLESEWKSVLKIGNIYKNPELIENNN